MVVNNLLNIKCFWCSKQRPHYSFRKIKQKNYPFCQWCYVSYLKGRTHGKGVNKTVWSDTEKIRSMGANYKKFLWREYVKKHRLAILMYQQLYYLRKKDNKVIPKKT